MENIEQIAHTFITWPSGRKTCDDPVHSAAERIGRQEVTLEGAIEAQNYMPVYVYVPGQTEYGLDPWRYTDGIDMYVSGDRFDIWFESGSCKTFSCDDYPMRFFVDRKRLA